MLSTIDSDQGYSASAVHLFHDVDSKCLPNYCLLIYLHDAIAKMQLSVWWPAVVQVPLNLSHATKELHEEKMPSKSFYQLFG